MSEVWKDIPSAPGWQASSYGRLKCSSQSVPMPNGGIKRLIVPPTYGCFDRKDFRFKQSVFGKTKWVAPLVCEAFHGPKPISTLECMHLDEVSTNNAPDNLAWGTKAENHHAPKYLASRREAALQMWAKRRASLDV